MSKISVLTAVFNDERHIRKCLDSLCDQTLKDIQIICIDDCSTDGTPAILEEYASRDSRITVLRQPENTGQAAARNSGIPFADGKYITMLDSDDWFAPDTLEKAWNALQKHPECDCAELRLTMCYPDEGGGLRTEVFPTEQYGEVLSGKDAFRLSINVKIHGLYVGRRELFEKYPYDDSCRVYSDDNTTSIHFLHSRNIVFCDGDYFYLKHDKSSTGTRGIQRLNFMLAKLSLKRSVEEEQDSGFLGDERESREILRLTESHLWQTTIDCYYFYYLYKKTFSEDERKWAKQQFKKVLSQICPSRLPWGLRLKPGYIPFKSWWVFSAEENIYFFLKHRISPSDHF